MTAPGNAATGALTYTSRTTGVCRVDAAGALTIRTSGICTIRVDAASTANYDAASDTFTLSVNPARPAGLGATAGNRQVMLSWENPGDNGITRHQIKQWSGGEPTPGTWEDLVGSGAGTTGHTVTDLTNGTGYSFRIRAVAGSLTDAESEVATATPAAGRPDSSNTSIIGGDVQPVQSSLSDALREGQLRPQRLLPDLPLCLAVAER